MYKMKSNMDIKKIINEQGFFVTKIPNLRKFKKLRDIFIKKNGI